MKLTNLTNRRSIRSYSEQVLSNEQVTNILNAAQYTPTSMGTQPFKLVVVRKNEIPAETLAALTYGQPHVAQADMVVFIFTVKRDQVDKQWLTEKLSFIPEAQREARVNSSITHFANRFDLPGAGYAVAVAMALEADANGVGSTNFSGFDLDAVAKFFANIVPSNYEPVLGVSFGIKSEQAMVYPKAVQPLENYVINFKK